MSTAKPESAAAINGISEIGMLPQLIEDAMYFGRVAAMKGWKLDPESGAGKKPTGEQVLFAVEPLAPSVRVIIGQEDIVNADEHPLAEDRKNFSEKDRYVGVLEGAVTTIEKEDVIFTQAFEEGPGNVLQLSADDLVANGVYLAPWEGIDRDNLRVERVVVYGAASELSGHARAYFDVAPWSAGRDEAIQRDTVKADKPVVFPTWLSGGFGNRLYRAEEWQQGQEASECPFVARVVTPDDTGDGGIWRPDSWVGRVLQKHSHFVRHPETIAHSVLSATCPIGSI